MAALERTALNSKTGHNLILTTAVAIFTIMASSIAVPDGHATAVTTLVRNVSFSMLFTDCQPCPLALLFTERAYEILGLLFFLPLHLFCTFSAASIVRHFALEAFKEC